MKYFILTILAFVASAHKPLFTDKAANARWLGTFSTKKNENVKIVLELTKTHTYSALIGLRCPQYDICYAERHIVW